VPRIVVVSEVAGSDPQVLWSERIDVPNLESKHFRDQLTERIEWAVADAQHVERADRGRPDPNGRGAPASVTLRPHDGLRLIRGLSA
jgi:hypothetical protein